MKSETLERHKHLEEVLTSLYFENGTISRESFISMLTSYYGIYEPLDRHLQSATDAYGKTFSYRKRVPRLRSDLLTLSITPEEVEQLSTISNEHLPSIQNQQELFGCLYVVEGSELGGSVMRKQLDSSLDEDALEADSFFRREADKTRKRWNQFTDRLNSVLTEDGALETAIQTANKTFELYEHGLT